MPVFGVLTSIEIHLREYHHPNYFARLVPEMGLF